MLDTQRYFCVILKRILYLIRMSFLDIEMGIVFGMVKYSVYAMLTRALMRCETRQKKPISKLSLGLKHTRKAHVERICHKVLALKNCREIAFLSIDAPLYTFRVKVLFLDAAIVCKS